MRPSELACPSCGAAPGKPCRTIVDGVDTQWDHDTRILAAMFTDAPSKVPDLSRVPLDVLPALGGDEGSSFGSSI